MAKRTPIFDDALCIACGICAQACPVSCLTMTRTGVDKWNKRYPEQGEAGCTGCGLCASACPMDAVAMREAAG